MPLLNWEGVLGAKFLIDNSTGVTVQKKQEQLLVFEPCIELGQTHELTQLLKQDLDEDSTR